MSFSKGNPRSLLPVIGNRETSASLGTYLPQRLELPRVPRPSTNVSYFICVMSSLQHFHKLLLLSFLLPGLLRPATKSIPLFSFSVINETINQSMSRVI